MSIKKNNIMSDSSSLFLHVSKYTIHCGKFFVFFYNNNNIVVFVLSNFNVLELIESTGKREMLLSMIHPFS